MSHVDVNNTHHSQALVAGNTAESMTPTHVTTVAQMRGIESSNPFCPQTEHIEDATEEAANMLAAPKPVTRAEFDALLARIDTFNQRSSQKI